MSAPERPADDPVRAPHSILPAYYATSEARRGFIARAFDAAAADYDRVDRLLAFGSGAWYRRQALLRAGLAPGMRMLDVAVGTGLVAKEAARIVAAAASSASIRARMMAASAGGLVLVRGRAEALPFAPSVRLPLARLRAAPRRRPRAVLASSGAAGRRPAARARDHAAGEQPRGALKVHARRCLPCAPVARDPTRRGCTRYYWDTIEACAPPSRVLATLAAAGFAGAERFVQLGIFSEYRATA
jgi:demethylmenaquinone methyltransferase/2-methoxy-6-polyprenyl-1,4-benzoquinol methylase